MTVATQSNIVTYPGNGVTTVFPFTFPVLVLTHLNVYSQEIASGDVSLYGTSSYSVSGIGSPNGGSVTLLGTPLPATKRLIITRQVPLTQDFDVSNQGGFYPENYEKEYDLQEMQIQQLKEEIDRSLRVGIGDTLAVIPRKAGRTNRFLGFDPAGDLSLGYLTVSNTTGVFAVTTRALLAAIVGPSNGQSCWVSEEGFAGWFEFSSADLSAEVTIDTQAGIFIAPNADATGASGAWIRKVVDSVFNIQWFGGAGDALAWGTGTSNTAAFNGALAVAPLFGPSCAILFPLAAGHYRFITAPNEITRGIKLVGQGWHENPGIVDGVGKAIPQNYTGSVCRFDPDVLGFVFSEYTDNLANATVFEFEASRYSIIEDLMLLSEGGVGTTAHGLNIYAPLRCRNIRISGFAGNDCHIVANTAGALRYGNANLTSFASCYFQAAKLHGVFIDGSDSNIISFYGCDFSNNGGCGSLDVTIIGVTNFDGCHYTANNKSWDGAGLPAGYSAAQRAKVVADAPALSDQTVGSAIQYRNKDYSGNDIGNESTYKGIYIEFGQGRKARLRRPTAVVGGFLSEVDYWTTDFSANVFGGGASRFSGISGETVVKTLTGTSQLTIETGGASFSELIFRNSAGITMDILSNTGISYFGSDSFVFRNAAGTGPTTIDLLNGGSYRISNQQVVGPRGAAVADATDAASAITQLNALLARCRTHGLIAP